MKVFEDAKVVAPASRSQMENPFIPISDAARLVIILYFVIWRMMPALAVGAADSTIATGYAIGIALARFGTEILLLLPFLVRRFGGTPIGWVHPLVLTTIISISFGLIRNPESLLLPFSVWTRSFQAPTHELFFGWSAAHIMEAQLLMNVSVFVAITCSYLGFALPRTRQRKVSRPITLNWLRLTLVFVFFLAIVLVFLQQQGGILNHMATLALGRFNMRESSGQFLVLNAFLPYILVLWYLQRPAAIRNPLFLGAFFLAAIMQFVMTGSRSGMFIAIAALLIAWMYVNRKLPTARAMLLGLAAMLLLNVLGEIRRSGRDGELDFSALTEFNIAGAWEASRDEVEQRANNADLAVFALVPQEIGHIYGVTYLAAVGFLVPRELWPDKPRGGGAYAAALLFQGLPTVDGYRGAAYPISGVAEAYWSFNIPGIIVVFLLYGTIMRMIVDWVRCERGNPFAIFTLIMFILMLNQPNTDNLVSFLQAITLLYVIKYFTAERIA